MDTHREIHLTTGVVFIATKLDGTDLGFDAHVQAVIAPTPDGRSALTLLDEEKVVSINLDHVVFHQPCPAPPTKAEAQERQAQAQAAQQARSSLLVPTVAPQR